jgi:uncharacterized protein (TIGR03663 family)
MRDIDLDRPLSERFRLEHLLYVLILAATLILRGWWLDKRPLHHDESIHAYYSWRIVDVGPSDYKYDPVYHGPTLYYLTGALEGLLGPSDFSARLLPVLCGLGLVALAWPLRLLIGRKEALAYALLVATSPTIGYYSRSLRHDVPVTFFTLAAVVAFLHAVRSRSTRLLYASALLIGLAAATKEDIYLTAFVFANAVWVVGIWAGDADTSVAARVRGWVADVLATLREWRFPLATGVLLALVVFLVFYTSLLTHPENWNATRRALRYWWGQHKIERIGGPWWYYLPLEVVYEPPIFFAALAVLASWIRRPNLTRERAFFAAWTILGFAIYAWAQEKVPWLLVPFLIPQAIIAAHAFAGASSKVLAGWSPVLGFTLWSLIASNYLYDAPRPSEPADASHQEPLVYVQSTYDVPRVIRRIQDVARRRKTGHRTPMVVSGEATWPLSWYLRDDPVHWGSLPDETDAAVLVVDVADAQRIAPDLAAEYEQQRFAVRGWWQVEWSEFSLRALLRFLVYRIAWNSPGTTDAVLFVTKNLDPSRPLARVRLKPAPPTRPYRSTPLPVRPERTIGGPGTFHEPRGMAFDSEQNLLVADTKNNRIVQVDPGGEVRANWGGPEAGDGPREFREPSDVAVAPDGSIYVADTWNHRIQKLDSSGAFVLEWREDSPGFWGPRSVEVGPDGTVFVADTGNKRVLAYDGNGQRIAAFGTEGSEPGEFIEPCGLAVDPEHGLLYVADTGNHRIQAFALDGKFREQWTAHGWEEFYTEPYLAWAPGALWASDSFNNRINAYASGGRLLRSIGGAEGVRLNRPIGVAVSPDGELYVSDTLNDRVVVLPAANARDGD